MWKQESGTNVTAYVFPELTAENHIAQIRRQITHVIWEVNAALDQDEQHQNLDSLIISRTCLRKALEELRIDGD